MTQAPTQCIFCGYRGKLTAEHVFSKWTHRYIPRTMRKYQKMAATSYEDRSEYKIFKRPGDIIDWKITCVCETRCNNGWMRQQVEERAKPVLTQLIEGEELRLTPHQQQLIATWATLKSMVSEYDYTSFVTTHHSQRTRMMTKRLPPEQTWGIWIGHFKRKDWKPFWLSHPFLLVSDRLAARRSTQKATYFNSHVTTQVVGQLFIQVLHAPMPNFIAHWKFVLPDGGSLFRIWPASSVSIKWPGQTMTDRDADVAAGAVHHFLLETQRRRDANSSL